MVPQTLFALVIATRSLLPGGHEAVEADRKEGIVAVRYEPESREVTNWASEAAGSLEPWPAAMLAAFLKVERPFVTRCVKLNNYWCIKSARWNGEIATDREGHVGFASADHGADAAVTLLRRYYLEFKRKSALDIVRRWAPAECHGVGIGGAAALAVKGIGGTLRARYLASRGKGRVVRYTVKGRGSRSGRVSMVIPMAPRTPSYRVPDIAAGMGEKKKPAAAPKPRIVKPRVAVQAGAPKSASICGSDEQRLRNYAGRMVRGLGLKPTDDLRLFAADGSPLPNLAPVMLAMSAFELGALRASPDLVERAIRRAVGRVEANAGGAPAGEEIPSGTAHP